MLERNTPFSEVIFVPIGAVEKIKYVSRPTSNGEDGISVQHIVEPAFDTVAVVLIEDRVYILVHLLQAVRIAILAHTLYPVSVVG